MKYKSPIVAIAKKACPAVITIVMSKDLPKIEGFYMMPYGDSGVVMPKFKDGLKESTKIGGGSGFIISQDGMIITNKHVVRDTEAKYTVLTNNGDEYDVVKMYRDPLNDLAILKIEATNLKPLALGDSSKLKLGQLAIAIGTPLGEFQNTITTGVISGLGRGITAGSPFEGFVEKLDGVIQTDAAISPGNSGGPLLNSSGQVIGVNTAIAGEGQNIGFAIPVNIVKELIDTFEKQGSTFERPYIGVRYQMIDKKTGEIKTAHTTNPVIFTRINNQTQKKESKTPNFGLTKFELSNIAPTILHNLGLKTPPKMLKTIIKL